MKTPLLLLFVCLALATKCFLDPLHGDNENDCTTLTTPCRTLDRALQVSSSVIFLPGTIEIGVDLPSIVIQGTPLQISSLTGSAETIFKCGSSQAFIVSEVTSLISITGFSFEDCTETIFSFSNCPDVQLSDIVIRNFQSRSRALLIMSSSNVLLSNSFFSSVSSSGSSPITLSTGTSLEIRDSYFENSPSDLSEKGGVVNAVDATLAVSNSTFKNTHAKQGGSIFGMKSRLLLTDLTFIDTSGLISSSSLVPSASGSGGSVYCDSCELEISNIHVKNSKSGQGGAFFFEQSTGQISNILIENCEAIHGGSAVFIRESNSFELSNLTVIMSSTEGLGTVVVSDCHDLYLKSLSIQSSTAQKGSGILIDGSRDVVLSEILIDFCTNYPLIVFGSRAIEISDSIISNSFGASSSIVSYSTAVTLSTVMFSNNTALDANGGALNLIGKGSAIISDCIFDTNSGDLGGAIFYTTLGPSPLPHHVIPSEISALESFTVDLLRTQFTDNSALAGGCFYLEGEAENFVFDSSTVDLSSGNSALVFGAFFASDPKIMNCSSVIQWDDVTTNEPMASVVITLLDFFNQIFELDFNRFVTLYPDEESNPDVPPLSLKGILHLKFQKGVAEFNDLTIFASPKDHPYRVWVTSHPLSPISFNLEVTSCLPGQGLDGNECRSCRAGSYNPNFGDQPCIPCPQGEWSYTEGAERCVPCPPGTFRDVLDSRPCEPCPSRHFSSNSSSTHCDVCPINQISNLKRDGCVCKGGMVPIFDLDDVMECERCPQGILCFGHEETCVNAGYWRPPHENLLTNLQNIYACTQGDCLGGCHAVLAGLPDPTNETLGCSEGATGVKCQSCKESFTRIDPWCEKCPPSFLVWILTLSTFLIYILIALVVHIDVETGLQSFASYKPLIRYIQALGACLSLFVVPFPTSLRMFLFYTRFISFDLDKSYFRNCALGHVDLINQSFLIAFRNAVILIPLIWALFFGLYMIRKVLTLGGVHAFKRTLQSALVCTQLVAPLVFSTFFHVFGCSPVSIDKNLSFYLNLDNTVQCYTNQWWSMVSIAILYFLLYIIIWTRILIHSSNEPPVADINEMENKLTFAISAAYKTKVPVYELIEQSFLIVLMGPINLVSRSTAFQLAVGLCVVFAYVAYHSQSWSLNFPWHNKVQLLYLVGILCTIIFGLVVRLVVPINIPNFFLYDSTSEIALDQSFSVWATILTIFLIAIMLLGLVSTIRYHFRRKMKDSEAASHYNVGFRTNKLMNPLVSLAQTHHTIELTPEGDQL
ncbi:hypothetical protein RCL1_008147 [Eukaryota sp. TZLM3-RCL]